MIRERRLLLWGFVLLLGVLGACASEDDTPEGAVHILTANGSVGPIMQQYLDRAIGDAEEADAKLAVIQMNTPGGLSSSMESIVQNILDSEVPIAVYVTPPGGRAASAGTFITLSAHVAVMAPNTRIGAASAVNADGSDIEGALGRKIENDAVALIRALAEERGRNADWAEDAVRDAIADNADAALEQNVVDYIATDIDDLLAQAEGSTVELRGGVPVELTGLTEAPRVENGMSSWERVLDVLANPTLASILISLGFLGLIFELSNPGLFLPGTAGAIAMILGFVGLGALQLETAGLVLIALALILFAIELFAPSGGILAGGGIVSLLIGGIITFRDTPAEVQPNRIVLGILLVVVVGSFLSLVVGLARVRRMERPSGVNAMVGQVAVARTPLTPDGFVFMEGERWRAHLDRGVANAGERLRVTAVDGFTLQVTKEVDGDTSASAPTRGA